MKFKSLLLGLSLTLVPFLPQIAFAEEADTTKQLNKLARNITNDIFAYREGVKIGFRPFFKGETSLNPQAADKLYLQFYTALNRYKDFGEFHYIDQRHMKELLQAREEYYMANPTKLLEAAQADIEIICHPQSLSNAIRLSCVASDLQNAITYSTREIEVPFDLQKEGATDYKYALENLALNLAPQVNDLHSTYRPVIIDMQSGRETELSQLLGNRLSGELQKQVGKIYKSALESYEANKVLNDALTPPAELSQQYSLKGELNKTSVDVYELHVTMQNNGKIVTSGSRLIKASSLPKTEVTNVNHNLGQIFTATGEAIISDKLDADAARRGAINLARARAVSQASGLPAPAFEKIATEAEASLILLNSLKFGIPIKESIVDLAATNNGKNIAIELHAEVKAIGTKLSPTIQAKLNKASYRAGDKIHINLSSAGHTNVGIYGWFADGSMIRIYPTKDQQAIALTKGRPLILPRPDEPQLMTAPMPIRGNKEDQEAIVIIASNEYFDFQSLAPRLGESINQTIEKAATAGDFFDRLGNMDLSRVSLTILPYQVHN
ncbi:hypothetical protein [Curvivirga aplysinae]|uniref:hypothetical protein n=1 Tax=Curvivirga aplysinae TaxID=2529852 RepID=UPI0012BBA0C8|nr:hypothetical protein [Curvivirga aplysinae]MTI08621.1 hypothetical protein [Curvivirga aplysinae]